MDQAISEYGYVECLLKGKEGLICLFERVRDTPKGAGNSSGCTLFYYTRFGKGNLPSTANWQVWPFFLNGKGKGTTQKTFG